MQFSIFNFHFSSRRRRPIAEGFTPSVEDGVAQHGYGATADTLSGAKKRVVTTRRSVAQRVLTPSFTAGFTLIEMLVAVAIFMFVMVVAVGSLVALVGADRKAQSISAVVDNLHFALVDMTYALATGYNYNGTTGCSGGFFQNSNDCRDGTSQIQFTPQNTTPDSPPNDQGFRFSAASECGADFQGGCIMRYTDQTGWLPITSPEIQIDPSASAFYVRGTLQGDGVQPVITAVVQGTITAGLSSPTKLHLETTITQRKPD